MSGIGIGIKTLDRGVVEVCICLHQCRFKFGRFFNGIAYVHPLIKESLIDDIVWNYYFLFGLLFGWLLWLYWLLLRCLHRRHHWLLLNHGHLLNLLLNRSWILQNWLSHLRYRPFLHWHGRWLYQGSSGLDLSHWLHLHRRLHWFCWLDLCRRRRLDLNRPSNLFKHLSHLCRVCHDRLRELARLVLLRRLRNRLFRLGWRSQKRWWLSILLYRLDLDRLHCLARWLRLLLGVCDQRLRLRDWLLTHLWHRRGRDWPHFSSLLLLCPRLLSRIHSELNSILNGRLILNVRLENLQRLTSRVLAIWWKYCLRLRRDPCWRLRHQYTLRIRHLLLSQRGLLRLLHDLVLLNDLQDRSLRIKIRMRLLI